MKSLPKKKYKKVNDARKHLQEKTSLKPKQMKQKKKAHKTKWMFEVSK